MSEVAVKVPPQYVAAWRDAVLREVAKDASAVEGEAKFMLDSAEDLREVRWADFTTVAKHLREDIAVWEQLDDSADPRADLVVNGPATALMAIAEEMARNESRHLAESLNIAPVVGVNPEPRMGAVAWALQAAEDKAEIVEIEREARNRGERS